jgi:hypothetical protein
VFSPEPSSDGGEERTMGRDETVRAFGGSSEHGGMDIPIQEPLFVRIVGECPESGFSAGENSSIGFDEMDCRFELSAKDFRKARCDRRILKWQIVQAVLGYVLPTANPHAAEVTVAIKDHEWLCGGQCDLIGSFHVELIAQGTLKR